MSVPGGAVIRHQGKAQGPAPHGPPWAGFPHGGRAALPPWASHPGSEPPSLRFSRLLLLQGPLLFPRPPPERFPVSGPGPRGRSPRPHPARPSSRRAGRAVPAQGPLAALLRPRQREPEPFEPRRRRRGPGAGVPSLGRAFPGPAGALRAGRRWGGVTGPLYCCTLPSVIRVI